MEFRPATRAGTKALIGVYGGSGSGKTLSALLLARGLVGPSGKIGVIDTESRRGEMYVGATINGQAIGDYQVLELTAPFSPQRYIDAIVAAEKAGIEALVIDSASHSWEGIGGVLDMAGEIAEKRFSRSDYNRGKEWDGTITFGDWKEPKIEHKHMMLKLLQTGMHVIVCLRAQYKSRQIDRKDYEKFGINSRANTTVIRDDYQSPIHDEKFIYEMTIHGELRSEEPGIIRLTKCPEMLRSAFQSGQPIGIETGKRIAAWASGGGHETVQEKTTVDDLLKRAEAAAKGGLDAYQSFFGDLPKADKLRLIDGKDHERLKGEAFKNDQRADGIDPDAPSDDEPPKYEQGDPDDFPGDR
jgi:hypothetical protein